MKRSNGSAVYILEFIGWGRYLILSQWVGGMLQVLWSASLPLYRVPLPLLSYVTWNLKSMDRQIYQSFLQKTIGFQREIFVHWALKIIGRTDVGLCDSFWWDWLSNKFCGPHCWVYTDDFNCSRVFKASVVCRSEHVIMTSTLRCKRYVNSCLHSN